MLILYLWGQVLNAAYKCTLQTYFWRTWPRSDARRGREPDRWVSPQRWLYTERSTSYSWSCSWSYSWTYVHRNKTMTSLILDHIAKSLSLPWSKYGEKDIILMLSRTKIVLVLILSYNWSRLNGVLAILAFVDNSLNLIIFFLYHQSLLVNYNN